jgi:thymidylate kinase
MGKKPKLDIHEKDTVYLERVRQIYLRLAKRPNWQVINCLSAGQLRTRESIHQEIISLLWKKKII